MIFCLCRCSLWCLEKVLQFITEYAYARAQAKHSNLVLTKIFAATESFARMPFALPALLSLFVFCRNQPDQPEIAWACEVYVAVTGKPFCSAARSSFVFFAKYPVQTALDKMASTVPGFARLEKLPEKIDMPKCQSNPKHVFSLMLYIFYLIFDLGWSFSTSNHTISTAQGGGGSFKNRKPIGRVGCCDSRMAERIHWWTERWLELCFLEWLKWLQWSPHHNCWM